ncbi:LacI family DNA-binding transcriptional regulator [Halanaerobium salsuginis]|uniref:LacI family transcriptional regulator n=1 Tax=Halanaerobium salsuginis TaxID=29563 RepID=A0A1I4JTP6_9FIRM|nr:LacI family DNA-binding transcriptional regulator [Halanaerobium salsuginis]SFL69623.1 LacI family transcriptional regulator [Halanaerobium salsuginis]
MKVTIKDIAHKADVSVSTVSKALNEKKGVSNFTRQKIINVAKELGYFSQYTKNDLKTYNLAFVISRRHIPVFNNPFYVRVIAGVEIEAEKNDYNLLFSTLSLKDLQSKEVPRIIKQNKVDGLILAGADLNQAMIRKIEELKFPTVLVDNYLKSPIMDSIVSDNFNGALQAVKYLVKMGHQQIGYAGGPDSHPSFSERQQAYKLALLENNLAIKNEYMIIADDLGENMTKNLCKRFMQLDKLPTAIFAANDAIAIGLMQNFKKYGIKIPEDISLIGFDNIEITAFTTPKISTIDIDKQAMGQEAARKLFARIADPEKKATKSVITTDLIARESVREI